MSGKPTAGRDVVVTRWSVHVPRVGLESVLGANWGPWLYSADQAPRVLGRKGLLGKEAATRMALGVVHTALGTVAADRRRDERVDPGVAVVVSSNLGNVGTVQNVALALRRSGLRDVSPLDAPNASSNIIASTIAIWFGFGGPNFTLCSGARSGLDAVALGGLLLRSGRARRVVVVGVEPEEPRAMALYAQGTSPPRSLNPAAATVVLECAGTEDDRHPVVTNRLCSDRAPIGGRRAENSIVTGPPDGFEGESRLIALDAIVGDTYGACGVLQTAVAAGLLVDDAGSRFCVARICCGSAEDGWTYAQLQLPERNRRAAEG